MSQHQIYPGYTGEPRRDNSASLLASATDLLNSWARDIGVTEARDESGIKQVIDRLWADTSREKFAARLASSLRETELLAALHVARSRMAHFTCEEAIQVDAAIGNARVRANDACGHPSKE